MFFGIIDKENETLIGNCGLHDVNNIDGRAEFGIFVGEKSYWGKRFRERCDPSYPRFWFQYPEPS